MNNCEKVYCAHTLTVLYATAICQLPTANWKLLHTPFYILPATINPNPKVIT